jgi:hypothetical protein
MTEGFKQSEEDKLKNLEEQVEKGKNWLMKNKRSLGLREEEALKTLETIRLVEFYSENGRYYYPVYRVSGKETGFEYYVSGGQIHIIG